MKLKNLLPVFLLPVILAALVTSCSEMSTWEKKEIDQINLYIRNLGDTAYVKKPSGLYYIELITGTGEMPGVGDTAVFRYKGSLLDGNVIDSNLDPDKDPYYHAIGSGDVIAGIDEGLTYMKAGGTSRFLTPSSLAYGHAGIWGVIPGYTPLVWEVTLLEVRQGPGK
jgi:FKBP-type peptidyl-prolyl cis-trans isomerase